MEREFFECNTHTIWIDFNDCNMLLEFTKKFLQKYDIAIKDNVKNMNESQDEINGYRISIENWNITVSSLLDNKEVQTRNVMDISDESDLYCMLEYLGILHEDIELEYSYYMYGVYYYECFIKYKEFKYGKYSIYLLVEQEYD